jgi:hypothetical protein
METNKRTYLPMAVIKFAATGSDSAANLIRNGSL